jgi:hypothetical protein
LRKASHLSKKDQVASISLGGFILLMTLGMKNENTKSDIENSTFQLSKPVQSPLAQISFTVPKKKVRMKVPTTIPKAVPKK